MKNHKTHTTKGGDRFLQNHLTESTPWSRSAYRPPANPLEADRIERILTIIGLIAGLTGIIAAGWYFSR